MNKRVVRIISMFLVLIIIFAGSVSAASTTKTANGITHTVSASSYSSEAGSYALCNTASSVTTIIYGYNAAGIQYTASDTGTTDALADVYVYGTPSYAIGNCQAVISGVTKNGPSCTASFS